ncbi:4-hydroxy-tetrahydrodipicolinate reductase [Oharaeibacter diazotrophicus]|uniref:4-hydroxy-tetrahydrodipicolinate reductase n=1 Tax=Oharaeibacter diazotrophicus TaxID=1920512 RepID=A0A4R6RH47_9HYPH|nr:4-hydroxy-tetrahydrodipicolinate reductase [Oharaeibacter diazotrophicus]TDP85147.1 dihydrodipicolinate reductase [Oharaeibacter diazotrophicus]BBE74117.1 4-hydroxy-tetrahydrodipicolinate reductase [Pleomorphomonas sp. SM30]GLS76195.1 4-hydroxy-tetrahydrodipicolinate reductase [Oharaeibacter diazotrophicus]
MTTRIVVAGSTGWVGRELVKAIAAAPDLALAGAVSRKAAGVDAGVAAGIAALGLTVVATVEEALTAPSDVVIDYTHPGSVKAHALAALGAGRRVVVGTSGLTADDYAEIDAAATAAGVGAFAAGNYSVTAALLLRFALEAARHVADVEVIDYAYEGKPDAPSGTARELAEKLADARRPGTQKPLDAVRGPREAYGAEIGGTRVHSVRLPGFVLSAEALFGAPGERLTIRHDAGSSAAPYVGGTLLAARKVGGWTGLRRGMDGLLG